MNNEQPIISIICLTYNHEKFIAQALDGFLMQKTSYRFEIIVHDDASTDRTVEIVKSYEHKYPKLFSNIYQDENLYSKGVGGVGRVIFNAAKGKYIAMCEGDDYWTDPTKLQKQVAFLETHLKYVGCFHNTEERYEDDEGKPSFLYCNFKSAISLSFENLCYGNVIPTCSVIYRNKLFGEFPEWFFSLKMGDWPLHLLNAEFGDYWYFPKVMGVHRLHGQSIWMLQNAKKNLEYIDEAYDVMITEYSKTPELQEKLTKGRNSFNLSRIEVTKPLKLRIKNFLHKIIDKI